MLQRKTPLRRKNHLRSAAPTSALKPRTSGLRRVSTKRAAELRLYSVARNRFLSEHRVCEVWLAENSFIWVTPGWYRGKGSNTDVNADLLLNNYRAPRATEVHHVAKRRGKMLLDEQHWLAVCHANHERIENNKTWARAQGFLLNF